jgi:hypothetical protein
MLLAALLVAAPSAPVAAINLETLKSWGVQVSQEIDETLRVPGTALYAETASLNGTRSGGFNGRAFVWPASTQFRVLNSLVQHNPAAYTTALRQFSDQLHTAYWNNGYRSGAGGGDRFYDDNAHLVVALAEAYTLTSDPVYLSRAVDTYSFVLQGEDSAAGGGIYFKQFDFSTKDAISTLQGARAAAMLHQAAGQQSYLNDATRLLSWARSHIQQSDGLFNQGFVIATNMPSGIPIVNSAGIGISANLEIYESTGNAAYLAEAQRIASRTLTRYFDAATGRINDEGYWAFELVDALNNLYLHDRNPLWRTRVHTAMGWLHDNKEDPNGHYGLFWGRNGPQVGALASWNLNEQASVARAYLDTAIAVLPGDVNQDGALTAADVQAFVTAWRSDTSALSSLEKLRAGDFDLNGTTSLSDFGILRQAMNNAGVVIPPSTFQALGIVPEPRAHILAAACLACIPLALRPSSTHDNSRTPRGPEAPSAPHRRQLKLT